MKAMAERYSERGRWADQDRRSPYEPRYRERDWGYGNRGADYGERGDTYSDRGIFERFIDELRSWFGNEEAQRRRMADEREDGRTRGDWSSRDWGRPREEWRGRSEEWRGRNEWEHEPVDRDWSRRWGYVEGREPGFGSRGYGMWGRERDWASGPYAGRGPRNYQRSDERIREDVCERLSQHSYLDPSDIEIVVDSGSVTLQGSVNDRWAKRTAEDIAEDVQGVKDVNNQLRVFTGESAHDRPRQDTQSRQTGQPRHWAA
jgi:hypothetical protein